MKQLQATRSVNLLNARVASDMLARVNITLALKTNKKNKLWLVKIVLFLSEQTVI